VNFLENVVDRGFVMSFFLRVVDALPTLQRGVSMLSSGTTGIATAGAGNYTLISAGGLQYNRLVITNKGTADGFFSVDGGNTWGYIPTVTSANAGSVEWRGISTSDVLIKRISGDMSGLYAFADWLDMR
jgi:hypothetical protein